MLAGCCTPRSQAASVKGDGDGEAKPSRAASVKPAPEVDDIKRDKPVDSSHVINADTPVMDVDVDEKLELENIVEQPPIMVSLR